jgi:hypothetical protein
MPTGHNASAHPEPTASAHPEHKANAHQAVPTLNPLSKGGLKLAGIWSSAGIALTGFAAMATVPAEVWTRPLIVTGCVLAVGIAIGFALRMQGGDTE